MLSPAGGREEKSEESSFRSDGASVANTRFEWREVAGAPGYEVSSGGAFRRAGRTIGGTLAHNGYRHIGLMVNGKQRWFLAHRLVAETFLENPERHPVVNHKDGDRRNNSVLNLEWSSRSHNAKHAWALKKSQ